MKKKIIALAVAAAFSTPAFADVGFYGIVDAAVAAISASGQKSDMQMLSGGASGSRIGLKATEDLGSGLTGVAVLEYALDTQTAGSVGAARQQMLAVASDFGTVATGYLQTTGYDFGVKFDPIAGSSVSPIQSITKGSGFLIGAVAGASRAQRALAYISPNISGLTLAANYSTALGGLGDLGVDASCTGAANVAAVNGATPAATTVACAKDGLKTTATLLSANYTLDALTVGAVYAATNNTNKAAGTATTKQASEYALGGSYDLGVAKLMGTFQSQKISNTVATDVITGGTALSFAAVVPVPTGAFAVLYAKNTLTNNSLNAGVKGKNFNGSGFTAGYLHTLSKTTTAYVGYSSVSNGADTNAYSVANNAVAGTTATNTAGTASLDNGGSSSLFAVGLRKKF
ncbi:MAG: porin [Sideroxydans sp.]|nr:porin [Sideroxydans sp.]